MPHPQALGGRHDISATLAPATHATTATVTTLAWHLLDGVTLLVRAYRNRRSASLLASADARTLADLGLTRADLRDAFAEPLWRDPTSLLRGRASERRHRAQRM